MEKKWEARLLGQKDEKALRELWEAVFTEDSASFLDYYDKWKLSDNECYGIYNREGLLVSMLQLNPYELKVGKNTFAESRYIIAVATRPEYRHRGLMSSLLKKSLQDMKEKGMPFTFLMPASEAIYYPFDFRYFYSMNTGILNNGAIDESRAALPELSVRPASAEDMTQIIRFSSEVLKENFDIYTKRDIHYYKMLEAELESEGGALLLAVSGESGEKDGQREEIRACIPYWGGNAPEVREILCRPEDGESVKDAAGRYFDRHFGVPVRADGVSFPMDSKKPIIMGRLVDAVSFLELFCAKRPVDIWISLTDDFLEENTGEYIWRLTPEGSRAERVEEGFLQAASLQRLKISCGAAELFSWLMGGKGEGFPEEVQVCMAPFINEIV